MKEYVFEYDKLKNKKIEYLDFSNKEELIFKAPEKDCSHQILNFILPNKLKEINGETIDKRLHINSIKACGVEYIESFAFLDSNIRYFDFEKSSLTKIERGTFICSNIEKIKLPDTLKTIDQSAFKDSKLNWIMLPKDLTSIGHKSFAGCVNLTKIAFPENLYWISSGAFEDCINLKEIVLSNSIEYITNDSFKGCNSLETLVLPKNIDIKNFEWLIDKEYFKKGNIKRIKYLGNTEDIIMHLRKKCEEKNLIFEANTIDSLLEQGKSFKQINKIFMKEIEVK